MLFTTAFQYKEYLVYGTSRRHTLTSSLFINRVYANVLFGKLRYMELLLKNSEGTWHISLCIFHYTTADIYSEKCFL